jgi:hypothetical protein
MRGVFFGGRGFLSLLLNCHRLEQQKQEIAEGFSYLLCSGDVQILSLLFQVIVVVTVSLWYKSGLAQMQVFFFFGRPQMFLLDQTCFR